MAKIIAERPAEHLDRVSFIIMRKPIPVSGADHNPGVKARKESRDRRPRLGAFFAGQTAQLLQAHNVAILVKDANVRALG